MFAPPRGAWDGLADDASVIELTLSGVSEPELQGDAAFNGDGYRLLRCVSGTASLSDCVPAS
ncbi:MAG: hypothetical protein OXI41_01950 [Chloroflexota bacterium]|nr:hypothetical protein [Chloroflexota bacterium]MDE2895190.1 hypothetical protein [Chloroflexota bacterium]